LRTPVENAGRTRRAATLAGGASAVVIALAIGACVIADPPSDLPTLPARRPTILRGSVVPTTSAVLSRWPDKVTVPVELSDPRSTIWYTAFVDYNPATGEGLDGEPTSSRFEPASTRGNVRILEIPITPPIRIDESRCHVIEVVVALRLKATTDPKNAHTPDEPGGDSVSWFFSPGGNLAGCPVLDAGIAEVEGGLE
jgi:hypothetical protein